MRKSRFFIAAILTITIISAHRPVGAVSGSDWRAGNIIDDSLFTDKDSMSVGDIQNWLNSKVGTGGYDSVPGQCDTNGSRNAQPFSSQTRAQYAASLGRSTKFTCLNNYYEVPKTSPGPSVPANNYGGKSIPIGAKSAAQLIWDAAQANNISPKVLLVTIQKESAGPLTTDDWPFEKQFTYAMGAHCPDSGPNHTANCDVNYSGFSLQISESAALFRYYLDNMEQPWWTYKKPGNNDILYNPDSGCGSSNVLIQNKVTAALYTYTPYQPNGAALANLYGTGDGCSAYGNRNFWRIYNDWFGTTNGSYPLLDAAYGGPRWMVINTDTYKYNPSTDQPTTDYGSGIISAGTQIRFIDKIYQNNKWYLRTAYDYDHDFYEAIPIENVSDIQPVAFEQPRFMLLKEGARKWNPRSITLLSNDAFSSGKRIKFVDKYYVNGQWFYRSEFDSLNNSVSAFFATSTVDVANAFVPLESPRAMTVKSGAQRINLRTGSVVSTYGNATDVGIVDKVYVDGAWYYRTESDSSSNQPITISATDTTETPRHTIATPYTVSIVANTTKHSLLNGGSLSEDPLTAGQIIKVLNIVTIGGAKYYQTEYDDKINAQKGILISETAISTPTFITLENPRNITIASTTQKMNILADEYVGPVLVSGTSLPFTSKTEIGGQWYLRTQYDTNNGLFYGIAIDKLNI